MSVGDSAEKTWVHDYLNAWNTRDGAEVTHFMTDDAVYTDFALGERFKGREAIQTFADGISETFSTDYRFEAGQIVTAGDKYAFEWSMSGTNDRANSERGLPATGQRYEIPGVLVGRLRDGKIVENRDYWNLAGYLVQVGLMPQPE